MSSTDCPINKDVIHFAIMAIEASAELDGCTPQEMYKLGMITVYHGTTQEVVCPLANVGRDSLDFGKGFYVTRIREQAERWARRIAFNNGSLPSVNSYSFNLDAALAEGFNYLAFDSYNKEWLDFIVSSRKKKRPWLPYDIIEGGVASYNL